jgi:retron-type reverse transcriptase
MPAKSWPVFAKTPKEKTMIVAVFKKRPRAALNQQLERLQRALKEETYQPLPVRQHPIPKRDKPGE